MSSAGRKPGRGRTSAARSAALAALEAGNIKEIEVEAIVQGSRGRYHNWGPHFGKHEFKEGARLLTGKPMLLEHGVSPEFGPHVYGEVQAWVDDVGNLKGKQKFDPNGSAHHRQVARELIEGKFKGVSFGQDKAEFIDNDIMFGIKTIKPTELSLVYEPAIKEARAEVVRCRLKDGSDELSIDLAPPTRDPSSWLYQYGPPGVENKAPPPPLFEQAYEGGFSQQAAIVASARAWGISRPHPSQSESQSHTAASSESTQRGEAKSHRFLVLEG